MVKLYYLQAMLERQASESFSRYLEDLAQALGRLFIPMWNTKSPGFYFKNLAKLFIVFSPVLSGLLSTFNLCSLIKPFSNIPFNIESPITKIVCFFKLCWLSYAFSCVLSFFSLLCPWCLWVLFFFKVNARKSYCILRSLILLQRTFKRKFVTAFFSINSFSRLDIQFWVCW